MLLRTLAMLALGGVLLMAQPARASTISGTLDSISDVDFFTFTVSEDAFVLAYVNNATFDPVLALFDAATNEIITVDDDNDASLFGLPLDSLDPALGGPLGAGDYILAVSEYDNFPIGPTLDEGYELFSGGTGGGTYDLTLQCYGLLDEKGLTPIEPPLTVAIPLPGAAWLLGMAVASLLVRRVRG